MLGSENSFGLGGYFRTPVEEALPPALVRAAEAVDTGAAADALARWVAASAG